MRDPTTPFVSRIFGGFTLYLLEQRSASHKRRDAKDLCRKVIAIATRLPEAVALDGAASLNRETLQGAYQQILEDAISDNQRQKLARTLRTFHRYLVEKRFVEQLDEGETFAIAKGSIAVDANLILEKEYGQALKTLEDWSSWKLRGRPPSREVREAACLLIILGYRCGLRRMEALKLQLNDFNENTPEELLVRPWEERRLKTPNATRKLPLRALLSGCELERLKSWKKHRVEQNESGRTSSVYLFALPKMEYTSVPETLIFPIIHDALRDATGDPNIRFHHARHSCASFLTYALLRPSRPTSDQTSDWLATWTAANSWISSRRLAHELYSNRFSTRRHLFSVVRILGHSSLEVSCANYIHTYGQLFALWRDEPQQSYSESTWAAASGFPERKIRKLCKTGSNWPLVSDVYNDAIGHGRTSHANTRASKQAESRVRLNQTPSEHSGQEVSVALDRLWLLLYLNQDESIKVEDLFHRLSLPEPFVEALLCVAAEISKTKNDYLSKPREGDESRIFSRFAARLWTVITDEQEVYYPLFRHLLENLGSTRNGLEFSPEQEKLARDYISLLKELKVNRDEIVFVRYASSEEFRFWHSIFRIKKADLKGSGRIQPAKPAGQKKADQNTAGIKLVFECSDGSKRASYGMRYLLTMTAIWIEAKARTARMPGQQESAAGSGSSSG